MYILRNGSGLHSNEQPVAPTDPNIDPRLDGDNASSADGAPEHQPTPPPVGADSSMEYNKPTNGFFGEVDQDLLSLRTEYPSTSAASREELDK